MSTPTHPVFIPGLRYHDCKAAIAWLGEAFGFEPAMVVPGEGDDIAHAQLTWRGSMIMVGTYRKHGGPFDDLVTTVREAGGVGTQSVYVVVPDADAHHDRAAAAGAKILMELMSPEYGGRVYTCADLEDNVWSFGTYDPFAATE